MSLFSTNQKSLSLLNEELSTLSIAKKERLDIDAKKKLIDGKMEYLRNEYEKEIAKVTEIRNKSKNLYKLKKGIEGWKNQVIIFKIIIFDLIFTKHWYFYRHLHHLLYVFYIKFINKYIN